jgi:23S rRNA pseudouridine2604 synthase
MAVQDGKERVAKLIAQKGWCSRREAERLIGAGQVLVNGQLMMNLGERVAVDANIVLKERGQRHLAELVTVVLNKPPGIVSTQPEGEQIPAHTLLTIENCDSPDAEGVHEVLRQPWTCAVCGRLDQHSRGLLVMSQDGKLARLITGGQAWSKRYEVVTDRDPTRAEVAALGNLRRLDSEMILPMQVKRVSAGKLTFVLREGRKHQIRRACELIGLRVDDLLRVQVGPWELGDLKEGRWRMVPREEVVAEVKRGAGGGAVEA